MNSSIRVLLVEDEMIVREALRALLSLEENICVVGEAESARGALAKAKGLKPDVIVMDLQLPDRSGIEVIEEINQSNPDARVLVLTGCSDDKQVTSALKAGAVGYLLKTQAATDLVQAIEHTHRGESFLHPSVARIMLRGLHHKNELPATQPRLTDAERRVLALVAQGDSNKQIAGDLGISYITVRAHLSSILNKLQVDNRTQAALYALRTGLVPSIVPLNNGSGMSGRVAHASVLH